MISSLLGRRRPAVSTRAADRKMPLRAAEGKACCLQAAPGNKVGGTNPAMVMCRSMEVAHLIVDRPADRQSVGPLVPLEGRGRRGWSAVRRRRRRKLVLTGPHDS